MPTIHFLCGLPASGKTTLAKQLAADHDAVRFTLDERMIAAHPQLTIFDDEYGRLVGLEKEAIWQEALVALESGRDVVVDWSLWSRTARAEWAARATAAGYPYLIHYLDRPLDSIKQQLAARNAAAPPGAHPIDMAEFDCFSQTLFERPSAEEGVHLQRHR